MYPVGYGVADLLVNIDMRPAHDSKPSAVTHLVASDSTDSPREQSRRISPISADRARLASTPTCTTQWHTRLSLTERKLAQVKNDLRYNPQSEYLRAECEKLEKMYADLLAEKPVA
jgi:hypothetical protein